MKSGVVPIRYTPTGLEFSDGSLLDADAIVWSTGFESNMRSMVREILGPDVDDQLEDFWGINAEGEIRGAYKPMQGWFML